VFDHLVRTRLTGTHLDFHVVREFALPKYNDVNYAWLALCLGGCHVKFAPEWLRMRRYLPDRSWFGAMALTQYERLRIRTIIEVGIAFNYGIDAESFLWILRDCDLETDVLLDRSRMGPLHERGFWRVDKTIMPQMRSTILAFIAFNDLLNGQRDHNERSRAISSFLTQNDGEGWEIPERVRLSDYGLGGEAGKEEVEVRSHFGPKRYRWQETQSVEESWRECHLHARNLLGAEGYAKLLSELSDSPTASATSSATAAEHPPKLPLPPHSTQTHSPSAMTRLLPARNEDK
jgi:hypothetical protein